MNALIRWLLEFLLLRGPPRSPPTDIIPGLLSLHDAYEGVVVTGGIGAGKSTGPMKTCIKSLMRHPSRPGFLVMACKPTEPDDWREYCRATGRLDDLVIFDKPYVFPFLRHEAEHGGIESAVGLMSDLVEAAAPTAGGHRDPFWVNSAKTLIRHAVAAVYFGAGSVDIPSLIRFIHSMPSSPADFESPRWVADYCSLCFAGAIARGFGDDIDLMQAKAYVSGFWPKLDSKVTGSIVAQAMTTLEPFTGAAVSPLVNGSGTPLTPSAITDEGKIVVIGTPVLTFREPGRMVNLAWKLAFQRHVLRRKPGPRTRPVVICTDEANWFACSGADALFQSVARASKCVSLMAFQNIPLLQKNLGGDAAETEVAGWLSNFQTWIACQNACMQTNRHISDLIGQETQLRMSGGGCHKDFDWLEHMKGYSQPDHGASWSEDIRPILPPEHFSKLPKARGGVVTAVVFGGGRRFPNGRHFTEATFDQNA